MENFARREPKTQRAYFEETASRLGVIPLVIEKDFWVCWILRQLFTELEIGRYLTFKGGTSLSKVHKVIRRFSEDVDLIVGRELLGRNAEFEEAASAGTNRRKKIMSAIREQCRNVVSSQIMASLRSLITGKLGPQGWTLNMSDETPDLPTLVFVYPRSDAADKHEYLHATVKMEFGARSENWPADTGVVTPYVAEEFPDEFEIQRCSVQTLSAERTLWEKVALLHEENCR